MTSKTPVHPIQSTTYKPALQESNGYLKAFRIVVQFHQFEVYIKLVAKTRYTGPVHLATEPLRQLRLDGGRQSWLRGILQTTNFRLLYCQLSLQVLDLGLQLCNQSPKVYSRIRSRHCAAGSTALHNHTTTKLRSR